MTGLPVVLVGLGVAVILLPSGGVLRRLREPAAPRWRRPSVDLARVVRRPRWLAGGTVMVGGSIGMALGGPVAAFLGAVYPVLGVRALVRRAVRRAAATARARSLDDLSAMAADLRAGLPPTGFSGAVLPAGDLLVRTEAAWALADRTGAPAADLIERVEADARASDRARATASAEAAGAHATAMLLLVLPLGGIALGFGMGVNPLGFLLHTALGAGCVLAAALLQTAGLLWCERLTGGAAW